MSHLDRLDPDARLVAEQLAAQLTTPLSEMTIAEVRTFLNSAPVPPIQAVASVEDVEVPADDRRVPVRIYRPSDAAGLPVLMYMHGGGWSVGTLAGVDELCRRLAVGAGCAVVSVDYRLAPEHKFPSGLEDCLAVFSWLRSSAGALGFDRRRIAVGGDSAGANLAIAVCLATRGDGEDPPVFQLLAYPAADTSFDRESWATFSDGPVLSIDVARWFMDLYVRSPADLMDPLVAPLRASTLAGLPAAHVLTAEVDPVRDDSEALAERLADDGVPVTSTRFDGVFHGFFVEVGAFAKTELAIQEACKALVSAFEL